MPRTATTAPIADPTGQRAYELRLNGMSWQGIADRLGYTIRQHAWQAAARYAATHGLSDEYVNRRSRRAADTFARRAGRTAQPVAAVDVNELTFGVEIEFRRPGSYGQYNLDPQTIADALNAAGVSTRVESYNHTTRGHWKLIHDASSDRELVSPILRGQDGLRQVRAAMRVLRELGCRVSRSEGMHVHVGAQDMTEVQIASVVRFYANHQTLIDTLVAQSRRSASHPGYCAGINDRFAAHVERNAAAGTLRQMGTDRYVTVNLQSLRQHGTIEFRQHQGSLSGEKASTWVQFLVAVVRAAKDGTLDNSTTATNVTDMLAQFVASGLLTSSVAARIAARAA